MSSFASFGRLTTMSAAVGLAVALGASNAALAGTVPYEFNLDTAQVGFPLHTNASIQPGGTDYLAGEIDGNAVGGGVTFFDDGDFTTNSGSSTSGAFEFIYDFTVSANTSLTAVTHDVVSLTPVAPITGFSVELVGPSLDIHGTALPNGSLAISAANLTPNTQYKLYVEGSVVPTPNAVTLFQGEISAVPVPGALVLFGSGLIGLGAFASRRRRLVAKTGAGAAVAAAMFLSPMTAAHAVTVSDTLTWDVTSTPLTPATSITPAGAIHLTPTITVVDNAAAKAGEQITLDAYLHTTSGRQAPIGPVSTVPSGNETFVYDFTVSQGSHLTGELDVSGALLNLGSSDFTLTNLTSSGAVGLTVNQDIEGNHNYLTISSANLAPGTKYALTITLPTYPTADGELNGTIYASAVPVPGSLMLFGSGVALVAGLSRRFKA